MANSTTLARDTRLSQAAVSSAFAARKRGHLARRAALSGIALFALAGTALAAPRGAQVASGNVQIESWRGNTSIQASNNAVINYSSFNIGRRETVTFIQPDATSRVLNRINGDSPTMIAGRLNANGQVYLINRAGIFFAGSAVVNAGNIFAAAGNLSDADFNAGLNNITDTGGAVVNDGHITAQAVTMVGQAVANHGTIEGLESSVLMAAGDNVYVRENPRGGMMVQIVNTASTLQGATPAEGAVANTGTINTRGGRVSMMAGDVYSLAIRNTGRISASTINVQGGMTSGEVRISGVLDASTFAPGQAGGTVNVTGHTVILDNATVDASGAAGGGNINIGGNFHGAGPLANSTTTLISTDTTLTADSRGTGSGGNIAIWSNGLTWFGGSISARGGSNGNGGMAEVSSAGQLGFYAKLVDLSTSNVNGTLGTLLLDPDTLNITSAVGTVDGNLPNISAGSSAGVQSVSLAAINTSLLTANVLLEATNLVNLTNQAGTTFTFTNLGAGRALTLQTTAATGSITFANTADGLAGAGGSFILNTGSGGINIGALNAANVALTATGGSVSLTGSNTGGGNFFSAGTTFAASGVIGTGAGTITLQHTGAVNTAGLTTTNALIAISGGAFTQTSGTINTGAGGNFLLQSLGGVNISTPIITGALRIGAAGGIALAAPVTATSVGLINTTSGDIVLDAANLVPLFAAQNTAAGGSVLFNTAAAALDIGTAAAVSGGGVTFANINGVTSTLGPIAINNTGGSVGVSQAVSAGAATGAGVVNIGSTGGVTQSGLGTVSGGSLNVSNTTAGNIDLQLAGNSVGTVALRNTFAGGQANFVGSAVLAVGSVGGTVSGSINIPAGVGVSTAANGSIFVFTSGAANLNLSLLQAVNAGNGIVRLGGSGNVTQTVAGVISAGTLGLLTQTAGSSNILLTDAPNQITQIAGRITGPGRRFEISSVTPIVVGTVPAGPALFNSGGQLDGISLAGGGGGPSVLLISGPGPSSLAINQPINAPGGTVRLQSSSGVGQGLNGVVNTVFLAISNSTAGDILFDGTNSNVSSFAAINNVAGGEIVFTDNDGIVVDTIPNSPANFNGGAPVVGITTTGGGNVTLLTFGTGSSLDINAPINAVGGIVRLSSQGGIFQNAQGDITANRLTLLNTDGSDILLTNAGNAFSFVSGQNDATGGLISLRSSLALTIDTVSSAGSIFNGGADITGINENNGAGITVVSGGALAVNAPINGATGGGTNTAQVRLAADGGVSQTLAGVISAGGLAVTNLTAGDIALDIAPNVLSIVAARNDAAGGLISIRSTSGLSVGTVTATPEFNGGIALSGIATAGNGDILLLDEGVAGGVAISQAVNAGTGVVRISSLNGISQSGLGIITASSVGALNTGIGNIDLSLANAVGTFAGRNTFAGGTLNFVSSTGLTIGTVTANPLTFNGGLDLVGVVTNAGDAFLGSGVGGPLTINQVVDVGNTNILRLASLGGITQAATGIITAGTLGATNATTGDITLDQANVVSTFAANNGAGGVAFNSAVSLTVGTVAAGPAGFNGGLALDGVTTDGSDLRLIVVGSITLTQALNAPGATVRLQSAGSITQSGAGIITANSLGAVNTDAAVGDITLTLNNLLTAAGATPATFAAFNNATGGAISFVNVGAFSIGSVLGIPATFGTPPGFTDVVGVNTATGNGDITLVSNTGGLLLSDAVNAGTGNVRLQAGGLNSGGILDIGQIAGATITGTTLGIVNAANGAVNLSGANVVTNLAVRSTGSGGFTFRNSGALTIDQLGGGIMEFNGGNAIDGIGVLGVIDVATEVGGAFGLTVNRPIIGGSGAITLATLATANAAPILVTPTGRVTSTTGNITLNTFAAGSTITVNGDPTNINGSDASIFSTTGNVLLQTNVNGSDITVADTDGTTDGFVIFTSGTIRFVHNTAGNNSNVNINGDVRGGQGVVAVTGATGAITIGGTGVRNIVSTGGQSGFTAPVAVNVDTNFDFGAGRAVFRGPITAGGPGINLTITSTFNPVFNANPAAIAPALLFGGNIGTLAQPFSSVTLGAPNTVSALSTIAFASTINNDGTIPSTVTPTPFEIDADTFNVLQGGKIVSIGNLTINSITRADLGDLSVLGDLVVNSPIINLRPRAGGPVRTANGLVAIDRGTDVAANTINFSSTPTLGGAALTGQALFLTFNTTAGTATIGGGSVAVSPLLTPITLARFTSGNFVLPLDLANQSPNDPAAALAGVVSEEAVQRTDPSQSISAATKKFLEELKISVRELAPGDILDFLNGFSYIDDSGSGARGAMSSGVGKITGRRINPEAAEGLRSDWYELAISPVTLLDENGNPLLDDQGQPRTQQRQERIRRVLEEAYVDFNNQAGGAETTPALFESFLATTPKHAEAYQALLDIRMFFKRLETIGLTRFELQEPRRQLLDYFYPEAMPREYFNELVTKPTLQTTMK
ncbi:hypothetical protein BH11PLA1_BH11PLA1_17810 [soil metagenome]